MDKSEYPPEWALDEALRRCGVAPDQKPLSDWRDATYATVVRLFALHIAAHEEPPVDPFAECIKLILGGFEGERHAQQYADSLRDEMAKRGLKIVEANPPAMTDKATLLALAEKVEKAEAGSLTLDKEILAALGYPWRGRGYNSHQWMGSACLTASIDAALTLADEETAAQALREAFSFIQATGWPVGDFKGALARATAAAALRSHAETQP
jgi:hypothetical protein